MTFPMPFWSGAVPVETPRDYRFLGNNPSTQTSVTSFSTATYTIGVAEQATRLIVLSLNVYRNGSSIVISSGSVVTDSGSYALASLVDRQSGSNHHVAIWYAIVPSGTTARIDATLSGSGGRPAYSVYALGGLTSTTATGALASTGTTGSTQTVSGLPGVAGGFVVVANMAESAPGFTSSQVTLVSDGQSTPESLDASASGTVISAPITITHPDSRGFLAATWY